MFFSEVKNESRYSLEISFLAASVKKDVQSLAEK